MLLSVLNSFVNTLRPRQNGRRFADDTFKRIFLNENARISIKISMKFVPKGPINNIPAMVQIMAWRRSGGKPLSEPMMVSLLTSICVTRPQWVNRWPLLSLIYAYTRMTLIYLQFIVTIFERTYFIMVSLFVCILKILASDFQVQIRKLFRGFRNYMENLYNFVVWIVSPDDIAHVCAR